MATPDRKPGPIPQEALTFLRGKTLRHGFDWRDVWGEEHAVAFTVAKAMTADVLTDIRTAIDEAIEDGSTFRTFAKDLTPLLQAKGWWGEQERFDPVTSEMRTVQLGSPRRLRTIYDANMRSARAAGQWERIEATKEFLPLLVYVLGPSRHHREAHVALAGKILPANDPFWNTYFPPNGWGCKCSVRQMGQVEADANGGVSKSPPLKTVPWVNERTGETLDVPVGCDPGWGHNAGKVALAQRKALTGKGAQP